MRASVLSHVMGTRVLKAHVDAVVNALEDATAVLRGTGDKRAFAEMLAQAAVTATDGKFACAVIAREGGVVVAFGPYATASAARKAVDRYQIPEGRVVPLVPGPKLKVKDIRVWSVDE